MQFDEFTYLPAIVEETPKNKAAGVVEVDTPEGRVKMRRNGDVFEYFALRSIAYRHLDAVARTHVLVHGGTFTKLEGAKVKEVVEEAPRGVFAALKTYGKRREMHKEINKFKWLGREEPLVARLRPREISFADFKK